MSFRGKLALFFFLVVVVPLMEEISRLPETSNAMPTTVLDAVLSATPLTLT